MYSFIYYFFYSYGKIRNPEPEFYAAGGVFLMLASHFMFLYALLRLFFDINLPTIGLNQPTNKIFGLIFFGLIFWLFTKFYLRNSDKIISRYNLKYKSSGKNIFSIINIILVITCYVAPLFAGIKLLGIVNLC
jgi:hypothetical protein